MPEEKPAAQPAPMPEVAPTPEPAPRIAPTELPSHKCFIRVFGEAIAFDPIFAAQVLKDEPGKRHYVDLNVDGRPEEVWFVDTDLRHPESMRPVLVRVIDEDGDLENGRDPDRDSDLYIADWKGDGSIDAVADYVDKDGDQDIAEMMLYRPGGPLAGGDDTVMTAWWSRDIGDDNLLWADAGYGYDLAHCQWNSHFGGNEEHAAFILPPDAAEWKPVFEAPFFFFNRDGDPMSEENLRLESDGLKITSMRHSFDADDDHTLDDQHDYDVSITARAPAAGIPFTDAETERFAFRERSTGPLLRFESVDTIVRPAAWESLLLMWDENDDNVEGVEYADRHERWEGVPAPAVDGMDQLGGPHTGTLNKRFELAVGTKPVAVYFHPADHRLHLAGAKKAWLEVDANYDRAPDMKYTMTDSDGDGALDSWSIDIDADGKEDDAWKSSTPVQPVNWNWSDIFAVQQKTLQTLPAQLFSLSERLAQAIAAKGADPVAAAVVTQVVQAGLKMPNGNLAITEKLLGSPESLRYYFDLRKDVHLAQLKKLHDNGAFWQTMADARGQGDYAKMQALVEQEFALSAPPAATLEQWVAARIAELNPAPRVGSAIDWIPDSLGWESELAAYRAYWGQIDFFGKRGRRLILADAANDTQNQIDSVWGMDALFVRDTSGVGGVTLYVNGEPYAVRSPGGKGVVTFEKSLVEQNNTRTVVEMKASNVGPIGAVYTVRMRFAIEADRRDTAVEVLVDGPDGNVLELGIGLTKLVRQEYTLDPQEGVMAVWGDQTPSIGIIGLGAVFPPERFLREGDVPGENHIVIKIERGAPLTYYIQADWLRGRQYPVAPVMENWFKELRTLRAVRLPK